MSTTRSTRILSAVLGVIGLCAVAHAATITGTVTFDGTPPQLPTISMDADPICAAKHSEPVHVESLVLGEGQTMGNVFVQVASGVPEKDYPVPTEPAVLDQAGCQYTPHVFAVRAGQPIRILNPDGTLHNIHAMPKVNAEFNQAMPQFRKEITKTFDKPEPIFPIKCDVHPWMQSYCVVMAHPYFDVTEADGKYTINDLPAGDYEIEAWHEKLGTKKVKVTVAEGDTKTVDFGFARPGA